MASIIEICPRCNRQIMPGEERHPLATPVHVRCTICDVCYTNCAHALNADERLTVLAWALKHAIADGGGEVITMYERLVELGVPVEILLADAKPYAAPPYHPDRFDLMRRVALSSSR